MNFIMCFKNKKNNSDSKNIDAYNINVVYARYGTSFTKSKNIHENFMMKSHVCIYKLNEFSLRLNKWTSIVP